MSNIYLAGSTTISVTATSPFTTMFIPSAITTPNGHRISDIAYNFGDGQMTVTTGMPASGAEKINVAHTFHRSLSSDPSLVTATVTAYEYITLQPKVYTVNITLELPAFTAATKLLETRTLNDGSVFAVIELDQSTVNQICNVIVKPVTTNSTQTTATSCVDPTSWNTAITLTPTASAVYGPAVTGQSVSGTYAFVSDAGYFLSPNYASVASAMVSLSANAALFGGNNNYTTGSYGSLSNNWSGYTYYINLSAAYPALGIRDLKGSTLDDTVIAAMLFSGDTWRYTVVEQPSAWHTVGFNTSAWLTGSSPIGYQSSLTLGTHVTGVSGASGCALDQLISSIYAVTTFAATTAINSCNSLRIRYMFNDAIAIYVNGQLALTDGLHTPYNDSDPRPQRSTSAVNLPQYVNAYIPISAVSIGTNHIAVRAMRGTTSVADDVMFDVELSAVIANNIEMPVSYGAAQLQKFKYLPGNRRYYKVNLPGDTDLFVLDSGINDGYKTVVEPDGVSVGGQQYSWLIDQINNSSARWKIAMFHVPYIGSFATPDRIWPQFNWGFNALGLDLILNGYTGCNEHLRDGNLNIVNCSAVAEIANIRSVSPATIWIDGRDGSNAKGSPAIVKITATQQQLTVQFIAVSNQAIIHEFKVT